MGLGAGKDGSNDDDARGPGFICFFNVDIKKYRRSLVDQSSALSVDIFFTVPLTWAENRAVNVMGSREGTVGTARV